MMMLAMVMFGLMMAGMIGGGLMVLHHLLKRKEQQMTMEKIKTTVIPEMEAMTNRMLNNCMEVAFDKTVEMTKKMTQMEHDD